MSQSVIYYLFLGDKHRAAVTLGCTVRTINRLIQRYKAEGKEACTIPDTTCSDILFLYDIKYEGANLRHFTELLEEQEQNQVQSTLATVEDPHLRRPCCVHFGEMLQMDASPHY